MRTPSDVTKHWMRMMQFSEDLDEIKRRGKAWDVRRTILALILRYIFAFAIMLTAVVSFLFERTIPNAVMGILIVAFAKHIAAIPLLACVYASALLAYFSTSPTRFTIINVIAVLIVPTIIASLILFWIRDIMLG